MAALCEALGLRLDLRDWAYFSHWLTPPGQPRRFDTRFFVALAPDGQEGSHDQTETVHSMWVRPQDALDRAEKGEIDLVFATQTTLRDLARFDTARKAYEHVDTSTLAARVKHVVQSCFNGRRIVVFSGGEFGSDEDTLFKGIRGLRDGGANGSIIGRNTFQRPKEKALQMLDTIIKIYQNEA